MAAVQLMCQHKKKKINNVHNIMGKNGGEKKTQISMNGETQVKKKVVVTGVGVCVEGGGAERGCVLGCGCGYGCGCWCRCGCGCGCVWKVYICVHIYIYVYINLRTCT